MGLAPCFSLSLFSPFLLCKVLSFAFTIAAPVDARLHEMQRALRVGRPEVWFRITLKNQATGEVSVVHAPPERARQDSFYKTENGVDLETVDSMPLTEWIVNNYKTFGANLEFVTNK